VPELLRAAERIVSEYFGGPVALRVEHLVPDRVVSVVARVRTASAPTHVPDTFIVKAARSAALAVANELRNDWAALQLLTDLSGDDVPPAPRRGTWLRPLDQAQCAGTGITMPMTSWWDAGTDGALAGCRRPGPGLDGRAPRTVQGTVELDTTTGEVALACPQSGVSYWRTTRTLTWDGVRKPARRPDVSSSGAWEPAR
jgi:hypothetical protein